jgi:dipeptidyl aminopeptidase/acylaminoacyl peptidase
LADEPATEDDLQFLVQTNFATAHAVFSPDGRWIAYESDESGANQIYVIPYPGPGGRNQVSIDGGSQPQWSPQGDELFFLSGTRMMVADVQTEAGFQAGNPRQLFESAALLAAGPQNSTAFQYAVAADGEQFLMLSTGGTSGDQQLRVVENWVDELGREVPR